MNHCVKRARVCGSLTIATLSLIKKPSLTTYCIFQHSFHVHQNTDNAHMQMHISTSKSSKINSNLIQFPLSRIFVYIDPYNLTKSKLKSILWSLQQKILDELQSILYQVYLNSHLGIHEHSATQKAIRQGPECLPRVKSNNRGVSNTLGKVKWLVPEARQQ